jgi:uncharacterized protein
MRPTPVPLRPWYREPWPWILMAAPAASIALGLVMWTLAVRTDDRLVANDYYKRGLAINKKIAQVAANAEPELGATVRVAGNGEVRAQVKGMTDSAIASTPTIRLKLAQPTRSTRDLVIVLTRDASGDYVGMLDEQAAGRWTVTLESNTWRLPTTTVAGRLTEIQLGVLVAERS